MDARDSLSNNADLWTEYFRQQSRAWLDPWDAADAESIEPLARVFTEAAGASVARIMALLVAPRIDQMFRTNAPEVSRFLQAASNSDHVEIATEFRAAATPRTRRSPRASGERSAGRRVRRETETLV